MRIFHLVALLLLVLFGFLLFCTVTKDISGAILAATGIILATMAIVRHDIIQHIKRGG